ncbi:VanZ family protein [Chloroflexota bacterium]
MMRKGIIFLCWLAVLGWMSAIFFLSTLPQEEVPRIGTLMPDYINHGIAYLVLAFLLFLTLQRTRRCSFTIASGVAVGWCLIFGLGMEFAQRYLTTNREFSLWDLLADVIGAAMPFLVLRALKKVGNTGKKLYSLLMGNSER